MSNVSDVLAIMDEFGLSFAWEVQPPIDQPEQDYWQGRAFSRHIAAAFAVSLRDLGLPPRYGFDARYRQRQKNRRKRRR